MKKGHSNLHKRTRGYVSIFPRDVYLLQLLYYIILYYIILYNIYSWEKYTFNPVSLSVSFLQKNIKFKYK